MALLKARPKIRLLVQNEIRPGDVITATVVLECRRGVAIDHVDVTFVGAEASYATGAATNAPILRQAVRLAGKRVLSKGRTELSCRFAVPVDAPATFTGRYVRIDYEIRVHVGLEWWPDAERTFEIKIVPIATPSPETKPALYSTRPAGPRATEPHIELSLASTWTRAGDMIRGAFALLNVGANDYTSAILRLRSIEHVRSGRASTPFPSTWWQIRLRPGNAQEGEMTPFELRIPSDVPPGFSGIAQTSGSCSLSYEFEIVVGVRWRNDLRIAVPFTVLPRSTQPGDAPLRLAPPTVGSDRLRAVWESVAAPRGLRYEAQAMRGRFGETELVIRRDHRGRAGIFLGAWLRFPELHLDLAIEPRSPIFRLGSNIMLGDARFDSDHDVDARDPQQAIAFLRPLIAKLSGATVRRFDDRSLALDIRDAGQSGASLARFADAAIEFAQHLEEARKEIPPPTSMIQALPSWRELATKMNGALETARMRIDGELGGLQAHVRVELDRRVRPMSTYLWIAPPTLLDDQHRFVWRASEGADAIDARFAGDLSELARVIATDAAEFRVEPDRLTLGIPKVLGVAMSASNAERRLERMAQLANLLRGHAGPYR